MQLIDLKGGIEITLDFTVQLSLKEVKNFLYPNRFPHQVIV